VPSDKNSQVLNIPDTKQINLQVNDSSFALNLSEDLLDLDESKENPENSIESPKSKRQKKEHSLPTENSTFTSSEDLLNLSCNFKNNFENSEIDNRKYNNNMEDTTANMTPNMINQNIVSAPNQAFENMPNNQNTQENGSQNDMEETVIPNSQSISVDNVSKTLDHDHEDMESHLSHLTNISTTTFSNSQPTHTTVMHQDTISLPQSTRIGVDPELEEIKKKVREMEAEAEKLKEMQNEVEAAMINNGNNTNTIQQQKNTGTIIWPSLEEKIEADARSIYVGQVEYLATAEEVELHFRGCGALNRVTILCDKFSGHPKGYAYIEFAHKESVETAMALDGSLFLGRPIKVMPKRTNKPGISTTDNRISSEIPRGRGRGRARGRGMSRGMSRGRGMGRGRGYMPRGSIPYPTRGSYSSYPM